MILERSNKVSGDLSRLTIAALLTDLVRLQARGCGSTTSEANEFKNWLKGVGLDETTSDIEKWSNIIDQARELALGRLPSDGNGEDVLRPLVSVFSKVSFDAEYHGCWSYLPAVTMGLSPTFPSSQPIALSAKTYDSLLESLQNQLRALKKPTPDNILLLLERYTSFIPYCPGGEEDLLSDIPFFDQVRLTAAIASSLYCYMTEDEGGPSGTVPNTAESLLLVGGDFSGVQPFIYNISSKGALKGLRGRSFFLEFFTEHVIHEILAQLGLSRCNLIFSGGSRFNLLLPNSPAVIEHLSEVRDNVNRYLREQHDARLYLALEWVAFSGLQLITLDTEETPGVTNKPSLAMVFEDLAAKLAGSKHNKFAEHLDSLLEPAMAPKGRKEGEIGQRLTKRQDKGRCPRCGNDEGSGWEFAIDEGAVEGCQICLDDQRIKFDECEVCHREDFLFPLPYFREEIERGDVPSACAFCCDLFHIGEHLPASKYIVRAGQGRKQEKIALTIGDTHYVFLNDERRDLFDGAGTIWVVNDLDSPLYGEGKAYPFYLAVYPREEEVAKAGEETHPDKVATEFESLAGQSTGSARIGALRMDVDDLGTIVTGRGFFRPQERNSLTRLSALSRYLTNFFKLYVNEFFRGEGLPCPQTRVIDTGKGQDTQTKRKAVIIYSGGDDLFTVGAWSDVAEVTFDLYCCFRHYTGSNPDITLSAGMVAREPHYPLHHLAGDAGKAEEAGKENRAGKNGRAKDSLALFFPSLLFPHQTGTSGPLQSGLTEGLVGLLERDAVRSALKWEDGLAPAPSALNLLELTKVLVKELADGQQNNTLQLKPGSRALIYRLLNVLSVRQTRGQLFFPLLYYSLSSPVAASKISGELQNRLLKLETISYLHPALNWVELLSRAR